MPWSVNARHFAFPLKIGPVTFHAYPSENFYYIENESTTSPPHWHSHWELFYVASGSIVCTVDGVPFHCPAEHFLLIPPHRFHQIDPKYNPGVTKERAVYALRFSVQSQQELPLLHAYFDQVQVTQPDSPLLHLLLQSLMQALQDDSQGIYATLPGILSSIMAELLRLAPVEHHLIFPNGSNLYLDTIRAQLDEFLPPLFPTQITIDDVARELSLPPETVNRAIKQIYGVSFTQFLRKTRIDAAKAMLCSTDQNVSDIAVSCGFETSSVFYEAFRKLVQCTPTQYRALHRKKENDTKEKLDDSVF